MNCKTLLQLSSFIFFFIISYSIQSQNLIPNPGFELGTGDDFDNWSKYNGASLLLETTIAGEYRSGTRALKADVTGTQANAGNPWSVQLVSDLVPTTVGSSYTFTVFAKSANGGTDIRFSTQPSALYSADYDVTTGWTQLSWTFTANESMTMIVLDLGENANTYYLDDMELTTPMTSQGLMNGGFELGIGDNFDNWTKQNGGSYIFETTMVGEFRSDSRAVKAIVDGTQPNAPEPWSIQLISDPVTTSMGAEYTFRVYARSDNGGTAIRFSTTGAMAQYSPDYTVGTAWTLLSWTFFANEPTSSIVFDLGANNNVYYLDDAELTMAPTDCGSLLNNGFEDSDASNEFLNWGEWNGANNITGTTATGEYRSGGRGVKIVNPTAANPWDVQLVSDPITTVIGAGYEFNIYAKQEVGSTVEMRFSTNPTAQYSANYALTDDWVQYTWSFVANESSTRVVLDLGEFAGTFYLDDACFVADCSGGYIPPAAQLPIATGKNKFIGCVHSQAQVPYAQHYFNQVTPENGGKWGSIETSDGVFDWSSVDAARAYAHNNGFQFRFHVLLWGAQQPTWLKPLSDAEKIQNIKDWMQAVHDHFDGSSPERAALEYIEVANETLQDPPNNINNVRPGYAFANDNTNDPGSGDYVDALKSLNAELGTSPSEYDWIVNGFKLAREIFGCDTKLMINEFGIESVQNQMMDYVDIVNLLKADNLIDAVGIQAHSFSTQKYDDSQSYADHTAYLISQVDLLATTGIPIIVTELDIDGNVSLDSNGSRVTTGTDAEKDAFQKSEFERIFGLYWNHPSVIGITLWGYRTGHWRDAQAAYIVDPCTDGERPALGEYLNDTVRNGNNPPLGTSFIPTLCVALEDAIVSCAGDIPAPDVNLIQACSTNCAGLMTISFQDSYSPSGPPLTGPYVVTRTYTVDDGCGNTNSVSQTFGVIYEYTMANANQLTGLQTATQDYEVDGQIESDQLVDGNSVMVDYDSGISITLKADFEVTVGSVFHAFIDGCGGI